MAMTIADLKASIATLPDDMPVYIRIQETTPGTPSIIPGYTVVGSVAQKTLDSVEVVRLQANVE